MTALRIGPHDDPEQATRSLAASMAAAAASREPDPDGLIHNVESWRDPAARRLAPALAAAARGHVVEWDPPAALTSVERWTCIHCGAAVLYRAEFDRTYGSAIENDCTRPCALHADRTAVAVIDWPGRGQKTACEPCAAHAEHHRLPVTRNPVRTSQ